MKRTAFVVVLLRLPNRATVAQDDLGYGPAAPLTSAATSPPNGLASGAAGTGGAGFARRDLPRLRTLDSFAANPRGGLTQGVDASGVVVTAGDASVLGVRFVMNADMLLGCLSSFRHFTALAGKGVECV